MSTVVVKSHEELARERESLLREAGMPEDELRSRAEAYELTLEQSAILREIDDVDFLLGD